VVNALRVFLAVVVALVGLATLVGLLDRLWWVFEPADVFRLQYLVVLGAAALAGLLLHRPRLAAIAAVLAAVNVAVLRAPASPGAATGSHAAASGELRLVEANVEVGNTDFATVEGLVSRTHADLFGVIELTPAMAHHLGKDLTGYRTRVIAPRDDAYGIGLYSRLPLQSAKVVRFPVDGPSTLVARLRVGGKLVTVVFTHVRTTFAGSIHTRHLDALAAARSRFGDRVVVCGDFNTPPWSGPLRHFAAKARLHDVYGRGAWRAYSWPTWASVLRVPLDDCFRSDSVDVVDHHNGPNVGSDHRPLVVDVGVR